MKRTAELLRQHEMHIFLFYLLFVLINWPFLAVPADHGPPALFIYLFAVWALFILLVFLVQWALRGEAAGEDDDDDGGP